MSILFGFKLDSIVCLQISQHALILNVRVEVCVCVCVFVCVSVKMNADMQ